MSDAVALLHPARREALVPFLDLDDESENSEGIYAEALEDGSFLLHTFQPFAIFAENPTEARAWLAQFGDALDDVHDDPRGVLFFPDTLEPEAQTYAGVVAEIGEEGVFIGLGAEAVGDPLAAHAAGMPGIDLQQLQAIAGQLLGAPGADGVSKPASPFEVAKLFEGLQSQLLASFGLEPAATVDAEDDQKQPPPSSSSSSSSKTPKR